MSEAAFSNPPYSTLKNEFIKALEKSIEDNMNLKLSTFPNIIEIQNHWNKVFGWKQSLDTFKQLVNFVENPSSSAPQANSSPITPSPSITEGEIIE